MKTLDNIGVADILCILEIQPVLKLKHLSIEEYEKGQFGREHPDVYDLLHNSKAGYISISKISNNPGYLLSGEGESGWTGAFGEGLSLIMEGLFSRFHTSVIKDIDWENKVFHTMNSTYSFIFHEIDDDKLMNFSSDDCKSKETE